MTNLDYEEHKGRMAIGRVHAGRIKRGSEVKVKYTLFTELFVHLRIKIYSWLCMFIPQYFSFFLQICTPDGACRPGKVNELFVFDNFTRVSADYVDAGDICVLCGMSDVLVGYC